MEIKADKTTKNFVKKNSVDFGFVKTCDEHGINEKRRCKIYPTSHSYLVLQILLLKKVTKKIKQK